MDLDEQAVRSSFSWRRGNSTWLHSSSAYNPKSDLAYLSARRRGFGRPSSVKERIHSASGERGVNPTAQGSQCPFDPPSHPLAVLLSEQP
jgi:hypothetical protein